MDIKTFILIYIIINIISFLAMGIDKIFAKKHLYRISEKTLLLFALIFGAIGSLFGMITFRHKTKHIKFKILIPLFIILNFTCFYLIFKYNLIIL